MVPKVTFNNVTWSTSNGISQSGRRDPLQGVERPPGFVPNDGLGGLDDDGFTITADDVLDIALDFVPIVGGAKNVYQGIRDGDGWQVALGAGSLVLDVATLGSASLAKGTVLATVKTGVRATKRSRSVLKKGAKLRRAQKARRAAEGSTFSMSTIDDAVSLTMTQKGLHLFANRLHPKPWLNNLATQMGGERNVINAALQNANGRIIPNARGIFNTPVSVGGLNFTIRGFVNQGKPIINSIFIP